jgi:hypothetical protein
VRSHGLFEVAKPKPIDNAIDNQRNCMTIIHQNGRAFAETILNFTYGGTFHNDSSMFGKLPNTYSIIQMQKNAIGF